MKKSRFTESQIVAVLKQHEAGVSVADLCREHGIKASFSKEEPSVNAEGVFCLLNK